MPQGMQLRSIAAFEIINRSFCFFQSQLHLSRFLSQTKTIFNLLFFGFLDMYNHRFVCCYDVFVCCVFHVFVAQATASPTAFIRLKHDQTWMETAGRDSNAMFFLQQLDVVVKLQVDAPCNLF